MTARNEILHLVVIGKLMCVGCEIRFIWIDILSPKILRAVCTFWLMDFYHQCAATFCCCSWWRWWWWWFDKM